MDLRVKRIGKPETEYVEIGCHEMNDTVSEIVTFVKSRQGRLTCLSDGEQFEIPVTDVLYIESVDNKSFIYTSENEYECKQKIYELEETLKEKKFIRISKSSILNLMKVKSIKPAMNGRFSAVLANGEEVIISRKYVPVLKSTLKGHK